MRNTKELVVAMGDNFQPAVMEDIAEDMTVAPGRAHLQYQQHESREPDKGTRATEQGLQCEAPNTTFREMLSQHDQNETDDTDAKALLGSACNSGTEMAENMKQL